jgi:hypothetical protein
MEVQDVEFSCGGSRVMELHYRCGLVTRHVKLRRYVTRQLTLGASVYALTTVVLGGGFHSMAGFVSNDARMDPDGLCTHLEFLR